MSDTCSDIVQGVRAFDAIDLIPNGFIDYIGQRPINTVQSVGGQLQTTTNFQTFQQLPSDRMSVELQYSVRSDLTGTSLNSLAPGGNAGNLVAGLAGGAATSLATAIGCSLLGDFNPTFSQFVFHICESQTFINVEIDITTDMISNGGIIGLPNYVLGVLGVTDVPIPFDKSQLPNLGIASGPTLGPTLSVAGQIQKSFNKFNAPSQPIFKYDDPSQNRFLNIVYDDRELFFRADNVSGENAFKNTSQDDISSKNIKIHIGGLAASSTSPSIKPVLKAGSKVYITYVGSTRPTLRHAMIAISSFFLFPAFLVEHIGTDEVSAWNYRSYSFKVRKDMISQNAAGTQIINRGNLADLANDQNIQSQITALQKNNLSPSDLAKKIVDLQNKLILENIDGQRLVECLNNTARNTPFIQGFYFADTRGIMSQVADQVSAPTVLIPRSQIKDQAWFTAFVDAFITKSTAFNEKGELDANAAGASSVLKGFVFDVSDHVNLACLDNEKYGYQRDFAIALGNVTAAGVGIPNLDLVINRVSGKNSYDLSSAKFQPFKMSSLEGSSYFIRDCNKTFTYDQQFCSFGTIQADMFIRTPFFFDDFGKTSRIYVERFSPQFSTRPDGGIWVQTQAVSGDGFSVATQPYNYYAGLVFNDSLSSTMNFHTFSDANVKIEQTAMIEDDANKDLNHTIFNVNSLTPSLLAYRGYDLIFGNSPSFSRGQEITTDAAQVLLGLLSSVDIYKSQSLPFTQDKTTGFVTISGLNNAKLLSLTITYSPKQSFLAFDPKSIAIIFPNNGWVIDNIFITYAGQYSVDPLAMTIGCGYYFDETARIIGDVLSTITIVDITANFITDDAYKKVNVLSQGSVSTVFDKRGNWYVFYEDGKADIGIQPDTPSSDDGAVLISSPAVEISCLISYDFGITWYDHKAIVRTANGEVVRTPYAITDKRSNKIHLFYVLDENLMHKEIDVGLFDISDAFKAYKRPSIFGSSTSDDIGISHFSQSGQSIRKIASIVVAGKISPNSSQDFFVEENGISLARQGKDLSYRYIYSNVNSFTTEFGSSDFVPYIDSKGSLKVVYIVNGLLYCRIRNSFDDWNEIISGIKIHRNFNTQDLKNINNIGITYNEYKNIMYFSYLVDEMLFVRGFDPNNLEIDSSSSSSVLGTDNTGGQTLFVVGSITDELARAIQTGQTNISFPYTVSSLKTFDDQMSISDVSCRGYVSSSGITRMFYKDSNGNLRAFTMQYPKPSLDVKFEIPG